MNVRCPHCRAKSRVADERVPLKGAWAKCPKCGERFFLRPPERAEEKTETAVSSEELRARILARVRGREGEAFTSRQPEDDAWPEVTVFPEASLSPARVTAIGFLLLALFLAVLGFFFRSAARVEIPPPPAPSAPQAANEEEILAVQAKNRLLRLRSRTIKSGLLSYSVHYTGDESRLFKHYAAKLAPGVCRDITGLTMHSEDAAYGFTLTADCLDGNRVDMKVRWRGTGAVISFPEYAVADGVGLFPEHR